MVSNVNVTSPTLVIGVGGLGKHVATHVKFFLENDFAGLPDKVGVFALDTAELDDVRRASISVIRDGAIDDFTLDYASGSSEFAHFGGNWGRHVLEIAQAERTPHPYIFQWLKEVDARHYKKLPDEELSAKKGVGRMRQASRACLFLKLGEDDFVRSLRSAVHKVAHYGTADKPLRVFVIGSIAGGTGCGALWDITILIHDLVRQGGYEPAQILGIVVLPGGFESLRGKDIKEDQYKEMRANCFAAYREMERLMHTVGLDSPLVINYSNILGGVTLDNRLYNYVYFVDGLALSYLAGKEEHKREIGRTDSSYLQYNRGIVPAIADFVYLHLFGYHDDYPGLSSTMSSHLNVSQAYPRDGSIYSSFGVHRLIFDAKGVVDTFAPKLGRAMAERFVDESLPRPGRNQVEENVLDFLRSAENVPLNRMVSELLQQPGDLPLSETHFMQMLRPHGVKNISFKPIDLSSRIKTSSRLSGRPSRDVISGAERLTGSHLGSSGDVLGPHANSGSVHAVLNHYLKQNRTRFYEVLRETIDSCADGTRRSASLLYTAEFLEMLGQVYTIVSGQLNDVADEIARRKKEVAAMVELAKGRIQSSNSGGDQKKYLAARQEEVKWERQAVQIGYMSQIIEEFKDTIAKLYEDVNKYINALKNARQHIIEVGSNSKHVRRDHADTFKVHTYLTGPDDQWEQRLFQLVCGVPPADEVERKLVELLPVIKMEDLYRELAWRVEREGDTIVFRGYLSDKYIPIEANQRDIEQWNYHFARHMVELGRFDTIIDNINIFDILAWKMLGGINDAGARESAAKAGVESLIDELKLASRIIVQHDKTAQVRPSRYKIRAAEADSRSRILAPWKRAEPGAWVSDLLQKQLGDTGGDYSITAHEIVAVSTLHFIRMDALPGLTNTEKVYLEQIREAYSRPVHVFLAEKNAADYERFMAGQRYPGIPRERFCPQVVALLEYESDLKTLARAYLLGKMRRELVEDKNIYQIDVMHGRSCYPIILPGILLHAAEKYCLPGGIDEATKAAFAEQINQEWVNIREGIKEEKVEKPDVFPRQLDAFASEAEKVRVEGSRNANAAEGDFMILLSLLIDKDVELIKTYIQQ